MTKRVESLSVWEFWSRFMTIAQFLIVVGVGTFITLYQISTSQKSLYAENMLKFDEMLSRDRIERLIIAIEEKKPLLSDKGGSFSEGDIEELLGDYEDLYKFYKMGLINKDLIDNDFSYDLVEAYDNKEIRNYMNQVRKEDGSDFYIGFETLAKLFK